VHGFGGFGRWRQDDWRGAGDHCGVDAKAAQRGAQFHVVQRIGGWQAPAVGAGVMQ
jgi:outer membrane protein assembly factor BamA